MTVWEAKLVKAFPRLWRGTVAILCELDGVPESAHLGPNNSGWGERVAS